MTVLTVVYPGPTRPQRRSLSQVCAQGSMPGYSLPSCIDILKTQDFEDTLISNVLRDLAFTRH